MATSIASTGCRHFAEVSRVIEGDLTGKPLFAALYTLKEFLRKLDMDVFLLFFFFNRSAAA